MAIVEVRAGWWYRCGCGWMSHWWKGGTTSTEFSNDREIGYHKKACPALGAIGSAFTVIIRPPVGLPDPRSEGPEIVMVQKWR